MRISWCDLDAMTLISVRRTIFKIFDFKNAMTLKTACCKSALQVRGPSGSLEMSTFDRAHALPIDVLISNYGYI